MDEDRPVRDTALLPVAIRWWVGGGVGVLVLLAAYLIAVRGTVILFDLGAAIGAICF
jgi:hypothetical protein